MTTKKLFDDIVNYIRIDAKNLSITYKGDEFFDPSDLIKEQLHQLPEMIQHISLKACLTRLIFELYYEGSLYKNYSATSHGIDPNIGIDWNFCSELRRNNSSNGWWNPNYSVTQMNEDGSLLAIKKGIVISAHKNDCNNNSITEGDVVSIKTPSSNIIQDFYMAYGNYTCSFDENVVLIFFNLDCNSAVSLTRIITNDLNQSKVPFVLHILNNPLKFRQYNSCFLRINKLDYVNTIDLVKKFCLEHTFSFIDEIPAFTKRVSNGISVAEAPLGQIFFPEGFGHTRCEVIAQALYHCHQSEQESSHSKIDYINRCFAESSIDVHHPYLNPGSEDIYKYLD
jgi:HopA1 effector protein family